MSEPQATSASTRASKPHPHSVAHEEIPPESRPVGSEEHGTTGPSDPPPGAPKGEQYPPQIHAGKVGYGPHYAEVHGKDTGFGAKVTGIKEQIKGKITRNHELEERGKERKTGELAAKERAEDDAKNPFNNKEVEEDKSAQSPAGTPGHKDSTSEIRPGAKKTDTEGAPTAERIPSSTTASTTEARDTTGSQRVPAGAQNVPTTGTHDVSGTKSHDVPITESREIPTAKSHDVPTTKPRDTPITKSQGAPIVETEQDREGAAIRH